MNRYTKNSLFGAVLLSYIVSLLACNGGTNPFTNIADGGIEGTSVGSVSGFGSVIVNDITYNTDDTQIFVNGEAASIEQLQLGMHVSIQGTQTEQNTGIAERIDYQDILRSPLTFSNATGSSLFISGNTVLTDADTVLLGFNATTELQPGDCLRVSGPAAGQRGITATLIARLAASDCEQQLISGIIRGLDTVNQRFFIGGTTIAYRQAQSLPLALENGALVAITAVASNPSLLEAQHIRLLELDTLPTGAFVDISGTVTAFNNVDDFAVEYRNMRLLDTARTPADFAERLVEGVQIKVNGTMAADGIIDINSLRFIRELSNASGSTTTEDIYRFNAPVQAIDTTAQQFTAFDINVRYDTHTRFIDVTESNLNLSASDLRAGDSIAVTGFVPVDSQTLLATSVLYQPFVQADNRQLQGIVSDFDAVQQRLKILGVAIHNNERTQFFDFRNQAFRFPPPGAPLLPIVEARVNPADLYNALTSQSLVYTQGMPDNRGGMLARVIILLGDL